MRSKKAGTTGDDCVRMTSYAIATMVREVTRSIGMRSRGVHGESGTCIARRCSVGHERQQRASVAPSWEPGRQGDAQREADGQREQPMKDLDPRTGLGRII